MTFRTWWRLGGTLLLALLVAGASPWAQSAADQPSSADRARQLASRASERIGALQREADRLAEAARTVFNDLRRLELDRAIAQQKQAQATAALEAVTAERDQALARVKALEAQRIANTPGLEERLVSIYKRGRGGYLRLLLSSDDPRAFGRLTRGVAAISTLDRMRVESHRRTLAAQRDALADLETRHAEVATSQQAAARAQGDLDAAVAARNTAIDALDQRRDLAARYVNELQMAQSSLEGTVGALDSTAVPALPFRPFRGDLDWPVRGRLLSRFGRAIDSRFGTSIVRNGIEIATTEGTPVRVVHGGTVAHAAPFSGFGTLVIVDHGGEVFTLYGHLSDTSLARGMSIARGDVVGMAGLAPAGPAAVYFEVRIDGRPADPLQWLRSSP